MIVMSKLSFFLDSSCCDRESCEDSSDVSSLLHRDDSELILLVYPNQESFFFVVEDTSASWPVSVETTWLQEPVSLLEQEVVFNQLGLLFFGHSGKRVVGAFELTSESFASFGDVGFNLISLFFGNSWS